MAKTILLFSDEQINLVLFYYGQDLYQKSQLGTRLDESGGYDTGEEVVDSRHSFVK